MVRKYKPKPGVKSRRKHNKDNIMKAVAAVENGLPYRKAEQQFDIPKSVIERHLKDRNTGPAGKPVALGDQIEEMLVKRIITCGEWGYPMDCLDLRIIVKGYLDRRGISIPSFKNNMPGIDWANSFLTRHKDALTLRMCQNIKRARAKVSPVTIRQYFDNLESTLNEVPPSNILNYDETNLADDPGRKKVILRRGTKYPERVMDSSKSAVSLMYAACGDGTLLPPYVVYKALHIYDAWTIGGPKGARYNRSKSGWFDLHCFRDWFEKIALPHLKSLTGKKIMLGDNLSSHLSADVVKMCEENNIHFCFLTPNSTHLSQPLDVAFFRPMKVAWRKILEKFKKSGAGRKQASIPKEVFPSLLRELTNTMQENAGENIRSGFEKCGIVPVNRENVLSRLPKETSAEGASGAGESNEGGARDMDESFLNVLREMRYDENPTQRKRKRRIDVDPGRSVSGADFPEDEEMPGTSSGNPGSSSGRKRQRQDAESDGSSATDFEDAISTVDDDSEDEGGEMGDLDQEDSQDSWSDSDNEPLAKMKQRADLNVQVDDFVLFEYDGEVYPGVVLVKEDLGCSIKAMAKSGCNWKWPKHEDILWYPMEDITEKIQPPKEINRGVLEVQELKQKVA